MIDIRVWAGNWEGRIIKNWFLLLSLHINFQSTFYMIGLWEVGGRGGGEGMTNINNLRQSDIQD